VRAGKYICTTSGSGSWNEVTAKRTHKNVFMFMHAKRMGGNEATFDKQWAISTCGWPRGSGVHLEHILGAEEHIWDMYRDTITVIDSNYALDTFGTCGSQRGAERAWATFSMRRGRAAGACVQHTVSFHSICHGM